MQKLFSLDKEDGESRKSLEYAVDALGLEKQRDFHRALSDAWYTARIFAAIDPEIADTFTSIDCFQNPRGKKDEIHVIYPGYEKHISREFDTREEILEDREIAVLISAFLRSLPWERRVIFLRRYWYGQDIGEIAEALHCGAGKVKSSLFRTRKALRAYLEQEGIAL